MAFQKDGPQSAGMRRGDVIKAINEKTINDIYEYMDRLSTLRKGDSTCAIKEMIKK